MHGSLSGKIKFRGYHRFRVNGSCIRNIFFALKNGRAVSTLVSTPRSLSSRFRKIRHVFFSVREFRRNDSRTSISKFVCSFGKGAKGIRVSFNGILIAGILTGDTINTFATTRALVRSPFKCKLRRVFHKTVIRVGYFLLRFNSSVI